MAVALTNLYSLRSLGFRQGSAVLGGALLGGGLAWSAVADEGAKKQVAAMGLRLFRVLGVDEGRIGDGELLGKMWTGLQSAANVTASSPFFYGMYHGIHRSGLPWREHVATAALKGLSGTLRATPAMVVFYGAATLLMPLLEEHLLREGLDKAQAQGLSQAAVFVGMGCPLEFYVEAKGCMVPRLSWGPALLGTAFTAGRLYAGVLTQYRAVEAAQRPEGEAAAGEYRDLAISLAGTTATQHLLNGAMQTMTHGHGVRGIWEYVMGGTTVGGGGAGGGAKQLAGTALQRILFTGVWNHLSHVDRGQPGWTKV